MADTSAAAPPELWALLVGIDQYASPTLNDLAGCVNDALALQALLVDQLNVPPERLRLLTNEQATRAGLLAAFREHLIENPALTPGSQILFAYSGHGSQMRSNDPFEPDGYDETLVVQDARTTDPTTGERIFDIPDKTIAALLAELAAAKGDRITVLFDCCHSGSATREVDGPGAVAARRAPPDDTAPPPTLDAAYAVAGATRGAGPSGWAGLSQNHVLLAGCQDSESSYEYRGPEGVQHGALSYFLLRELQTLRPGTTYAELHERVAAQVNAVYRNQLPQCEGDRDREVFGGLRVARSPFLAVTEVQGSRVRLAAGAVHGLAPGTRLAAYAPEVRNPDDLAKAQPLAQLTVAEVGPTSAWANVEPDEAGAIPTVPQHARAVLLARARGGDTQTVSLEALDPVLQPEVDALRDLVAASAFLTLAPDASPAALRVQARAGQFHVYGQGGESLVEPSELGARAAGVLRALEVIARGRALAALRNEAATSAVQGAVRLALRQFQRGVAPAELPLVQPGAGGDWVLPCTEGPDPDANRYLLEVQNASPQALFPHVFFVGSDFSVTPIFPLHGEDVRIPAGGTVLLRQMGATETGLFRVQLDPGQALSRDRLKVLLTEQRLDLAALAQSGVAATRDVTPLSSPEAVLAAEFDAWAGAVAGTRGGAPDVVAAGEDWGVAELALTVVRAADGQVLPADGAAVDLGGGLVLQAPAGLNGTITVGTAAQAGRGDAPGIPAPPGLREPGRAVSPVTLGSTRGAAPEGLVVDLALADDSWRAVTPATPLRLRLPTAAVADASAVLAVAYDGQDYLPVGSSAGSVGEIEVSRVPEPSASGGATTERGIGNLVRFFFYKQLGLTSDDLGLRRVELGEDGQPRLAADGRPIYSQLDASQFRAGERAALVVHGFSDDTRGLARGLAATVQRKTPRYDHLLTFDYETFGTGVAENGATLADALRQQCGFGPSDGVTLHVYAHSMGCLVTRCLIELSGGDAFVDGAMLAGGPNRGTPWANTGRGLSYLAAVLLNQVGTGIPVGLLSMPFDFLRIHDTGLADLQTDSPITQELNGRSTPDNVPYLVLAGTNSGTDAAREQSERLAAKTLDLALDTLFGDQNDAVIGMASMAGVRLGNYPRLTVQVLPCNHAGYFHTPEATAALRGWMP
jgi:hypothetical protein